MNPQQIAFLIILAVAFGLLLTERLRNDLVALLMVLALFATGILNADEALSGFSSEPAIVVAAIFVMSAALHATGLAETIGGWVGRLAGSRLSRALLVIMPSVALLSAFTHHVATTAMMLPVTMNLARDKDMPVSKLLMPLSFAASLGTTITIIGAPAFLIASSILQRAGHPGLGVFSIAPIGLVITAAGTLFMLTIGRFLLPAHKAVEDPANLFKLADYFTEVTILPDSPLLGKTMQEIQEDKTFEINVVEWMRDGKGMPRPYRDQCTQEGDVLLVRAAPEDIVAIRSETGVELQPVQKYQPKVESNGAVEDASEQFVQVVVAPRSEFIGRTIGEIDFAEHYEVIVVAMWRRQSWLRQELSRIRLREGDVLVVEGSEEALARLSNDPNFLMMVPFHGELRRRRKASLAGGIMLASIAVAAFFSHIPLEMVMLAGATAMVLFGTITARQAYRAIDVRIFVFIAGAIPLGVAMEKTGVSELMAGWLQGTVSGWNPTLILLLIFAIVAVLTQFMSDSATTALFAPVALALAQGLHQAPEPYVVTVAMASVASFLTPIGHHGNLLVYGPGRYQFSDFVKVGTPLTIIVGILVVVVARLVWPG